MNRTISCACVFTCLWLIDSTATAAEIQYNRDIRPILADNCFACHGPDSAARKAGLRLDLRDEAVKAKAIIPGKPSESSLIVRTHTEDLTDVMPPIKTRKKLTPAQKSLLKEWIASGAEYQAHWSYITPKRSELPVVKNAGWARNPIDRFILADLEKRGLQPAPEADRRTLARRLSLDLIGLPPTPAEVDEFVNDKSADYYEKYVKKLMDSPHWGEHRGRYWLDVARYADTHGIHFDNFREVWSYRDWVIRAFNENKKFDRFTIEQLAGDLLPDKTLDTQVASGFNRCNITSAEGGMIAEEYLVLYTRDRTETTALTWLGMTAGCAVCHSHKFDPLSQREFYELAAFFNNTTQGASDGNVQNTPPIITVPKTEDRPRWEAVTKEIAELQGKLTRRKQEARGDFDKWIVVKRREGVQKLASRIGSHTLNATAAKPLAPVVVEIIQELARNDGGGAAGTTSQGLVFRAPLNEGKGKEFNVTVAGQPRKLTLDSGYTWVPGRSTDKAFSVQPGASLEVADAGDFDKAQNYTVSAWVKLTKRNQAGAIVARMDSGNKYRGWDLWTQNDRIGMHLVSSWPEDALKVVARTPLKINEWTHVIVGYDGTAKSSGVKIYYNGVLQPTDVESDKLQGTTRTKVPLKIGQRNTGERLTGAVVQDIRLYDRALNGVEAEQLAKAERTAELLAKPADKRTSQEMSELFDWWLAANDSRYREIDTILSLAQQEEVAIKSRGTIAHVMNEKMEQPSAFVLFRGDYDKKREPVKPGTPKALPPFAESLPKNRLGLAQWLLQPDHPLTARVTVNRFWQDVFGTGIVRTSGDFGVAGDLPTHPELLDWMAVEFREAGWDVKKFFTLLVTSATYRQAAIANPDKLEKDPQNRLLSRGPRFRMDAEMIRDYALASSGLLVKKLGGPSVKPYQPTGVWEAVAMIGSNTRNYQPDKGENLYRRSMYTFWKRAAPPASMDIFNAPNRETCATRRERTNTPLQALVTLNDPQFVEAARVLAQVTLKEGGNTEESRLDFMAKRILCRPLRAEETKIIQSVQKELLDYYKAQPAEAKKLLTYGDSPTDGAMDAAGLAAWTMVANQLFNLDEVLNK